MNALEDRIRAAARAAADTVPPDSVPPLRRPDEAGDRNGVTRLSWSLSRWARLLAPLAAAAAVVVLAVTTVMIAQYRHAAPGPGPASPAPSASPVTGPDGVPPYYVSLAANGNPNFAPSYAVVRMTATGAALGMIQPSVPGGTVLAASAAADDRTFVLDEEKFAGTTSKVNGPTETRSFFLLRLNQNGKPGALTRLPVTVSGLLTGFALSPDGTRLALAVQPQRRSNPNLEELRVYTLATRAVRIWTGEGVIGSGPDDARSVSWTGDGQRLLFDWGPAVTSLAGDGPWLLDTTLPGSGLVADSRQVVSFAGAGPDGLSCQGDDIVTPDGSAVICGALKVLSTGSRTVAIAFFEYSVSTGRVTRTLYRRRTTAKAGGVLTVNVLWSDAGGATLIVAIPGPGSGNTGIVQGSTFTRLHIPSVENGAYAGTW